MVHGGARSTPVSACSIPRSDIQDRRSCTTPRPVRGTLPFVIDQYVYEPGV